MTVNPRTPPERLEAIRQRIADAAARTGRDPASVTLVAVSKTFGPEAIRPVLAAGQRIFGENRVQEARDKWPALKEAFPDAELHLIGPLQSNKAREAVRLFDVIQTVDRDKIAAAIARVGREESRMPRLLVEVNVGEEPQKAGIAPAETDAFVQRCRETHGLAIEGLMAIPPADADPVPHFRALAALARTLSLATVSMGMSGDFETAIREGATMVRVGSAIFGERARTG